MYVYTLAQCTWCGSTITFRSLDDYMYVCMYVAMYSVLMFSQFTRCFYRINNKYMLFCMYVYCVHVHGVGFVQL